MLKIERIRLDWRTYLNLIDSLYEMIDWKKEKFKSIVAISRGGNIPSTIFSNRTNLPLTVLNKGGIIYEREKFLVIEDCVDTGKTLSGINYLSQGPRLEYHPLAYANKDFKTAVLHYKKHSKVKPDYFVETTNKWIVYPYEVE